MRCCLKLAEIFSVSTDVLLKDELDLNQPETFDTPAASVAVPDETEPPLRNVTMAETNDFLEKNEKHSNLTALGTALCIASPIAPILFDVIAKDTKAADIGVVLMFVMIAAATGVFIYAGMLMKPFEFLKHEQIDTEYGVDGMVKEKKTKYQPKHTLNVIIGVILCITCVLPPIIFDILELNGDISAMLMFVILAAAVGLLVKTGIISSGFEKILQEDSYSRKKKQEGKRIGAVMGSYWLIVTAVYLGVSFIANSWGMSWVIWVIAGVLSPIVAIIAKSFKKEK